VTQYLQYAKAGVDYLRRNAFDRTNGGTHVFRGTIQSIQTKPNPNGGTIYTVDYTGLRF
jgi:hypothetical protein